jgi:YVTN family beta-propeller protein
VTTEQPLAPFCRNVLEHPEPWKGSDMSMLARMTRAGFALIAFCYISASGRAAEIELPLVLESTIPLLNVSGPLEHLAADGSRKRLFVAEQANNTLDVIDLATQKQLRSISGLADPQGIAYLPEGDLVVVANHGDGSVRFFSGSDFSVRGIVPLGDGADNVRVDPRNGHVLVGFDTNRIAIINPYTPKWLQNIPLPSHAERFAISTTDRMFVNVPAAGKIVMVDLTSETGASWLTRGLEGNFPMTLDDASRTVIVAFRNPARLAMFDMRTGAMIATADTCADAGELSFDGKRRRVYVSCGVGAIDVIDTSPNKLTRGARITTPQGARTSLFVPELDRLYLAVPSSPKSSAAIEIYRPNP